MGASCEMKLQLKKKYTVSSIWELVDTLLKDYVIEPEDLDETENKLLSCVYV